MADFDIEQLKSLMESLGDRLDKTQGDKLSRDELNRIRLLLTKMTGKLTKPSSGSSSTRDSKKFIDDFFKEWKRQNPLKDAAARAPRNTILRDEQQRRRGSQEGNTILDREMRRTGGSMGQLGRDAQLAGRGLGAFGTRLLGATASFAGMAVESGKALGKIKAMVGDRIDNYRAFLASGEGSVDSIQDMGREAARAGLTTKQLADAMLEGTQGARQMGAIKFAQVNKGIRDLTFSTGNLGMSFDDLMSAQQDYATILGLRGNTQNSSQQQMVQGMFQVVRSSEATANILGLTRKEALQAAKDNASDANTSASMDARGFNEKQMAAMSAVQTEMARTYGDAGKLLINDVIRTGSVQSKRAADLAALHPELLGIAQRSAASVANNRDADPRAIAYQTASLLRNDADRSRANKSLEGQMAIIGGSENSPVAEAATSLNAGRFAASNIKTDARANAGSQQDQNPERASVVGLLQGSELKQELNAVKEAWVTAFFNPMVSTYGPFLRNQVNPNLKSFNDSLINGALGAEKHTTLMTSLGTAILGTLGAISLFSSALSALGVAKTGLGALRGLGSGAAGVGGSMASGLGAMALPAAGAAVGTVGMWAGGRMIQNRQSDKSDFGIGKNDQGFMGSRAMGLGSSIAGGAALGAGIGSVVPVLGTAVGAGVGALVGAGYGAWTNGSANASQMTSQGPLRPIQQQSGTSPMPADASGQRPRNTLTPDQMSMKIMEASERGANTLKMIKDNGDRQVDLLREEIAVLRGMNDRVTRLLEDGNKNTRTMVDHAT